MKVGVVTHNVIKGDGQGRVNYELVRTLLARGMDVELIADRVAPELLDSGATWVPVHPKSERVNLVKVWRFARLADRVLDRLADRYDVLFACGFVLSRPHGINAAHFVHGSWLRSPYHWSRVRPGLNGTYQRVYSTWNARWERVAFDQARVVVALSGMVRRELVEIGVAPDKIATIINGVDLNEFKPGPADRAALGLPEGVPLGLFVGDLRSPIKNLDALLHALPAVPGVHLAVAGALERSPYPALSEALGLGGRVHFLGFRDDVAALMRAADFFALPSRRDSCPLVMLEAMASGLPVITARTVGTAPLVTSEVGFVLEGPDDAETMRTGLQTFADDPDRCAAMGRAARAAAMDYSWEAMADRYIALFETVAR